MVWLDPIRGIHRELTGQEKITLGVFEDEIEGFHELNQPMVAFLWVAVGGEEAGEVGEGEEASFFCEASIDEERVDTMGDPFGIEGTEFAEMGIVGKADDAAE